MSTQKLEQVLFDSYDDFRLSTDEKHEFKRLLEEFKQDPTKLSFIRNKAFSFVADNFRSENPTYHASLKWLENVVKSIDSTRNSSSIISDSYYSPGDQCASKIISLLNRAKYSVDICVFTISDNNISKAISAAHQRGVKVKIVSDNDKANDLGSDIYSLAKQGLNIRIDRTPNHMHHKFAVVDSKELINGSFNWTRSASKYNHENVVVTNDIQLVESFLKEFEKLWKESERVEIT